MELKYVKFQKAKIRREEILGMTSREGCSIGGALAQLSPRLRLVLQKDFGKSEMEAECRLTCVVAGFGHSQ
jgi:hypothetical protein